ncbi:MAG: DUF11 domain-containing protein [Cytophagaceae bacterium]|nr:MAG: DUF11 domain-containing protein [Cytophagaceae bacterium]
MNELGLPYKQYASSTSQLVGWPYNGFRATLATGFWRLASRVLGSRRTKRPGGSLVRVGVLLLSLLSLSVAAYSQATIDLSVHTHIDRSKPALGDVVTYTVVVSNAPSMSTATGVVVKNTLPTGATFLPSSAVVARGTGSYDA